MGWLLIVSIAAMTSFMTMVQLIVLTLTTPARQPDTVQIAKSVPAKTVATKMRKPTARKAAKRHTPRVRPA
jgi:hypothetical protein